MSKINAEIVADSVNVQGDRLTSVLVTMPRIILSEMNTHRMLSKNTSSSRAIPFNKMVEAVQNDPFIPIAWQKEHKGMQGSEYFNTHASITKDYNQDIHYGFWMDARDEAIRMATCLHDEGLTKQLCNRLLEPFMWTTMLITGPKLGWDNFFNLRCPQYETNSGKGFRSRKDALAAQLNVKDPGKDFVKQSYEEDFNMEWFLANKGQAEIHMMALAECIWDAYNESTPRQLKSGEWHIPFEDKIDRFVNIPLDSEVTDPMIEINILHNKIFTSVAMGARTSYTVVGEEKEINHEALIGLHDRLLAQDPPHSSPLEHCARAMSNEEHNSYLKGVIELIDIDEPEYSGGIYEPKFSEKGWCNNFKGFIPYRYLVDNKISI